MDSGKGLGRERGMAHNLWDRGEDNGVGWGGKCSYIVKSYI